MNITVERIKSDNDATLSLVYIDGTFECFGIEVSFNMLGHQDVIS